MKYFVAYLLSGDAKVYHERLTRELSEKYRITPLHERIPPHITVKAPFETDEMGIADVERTLRSFAHNEYATPMTLRGFGRFGFRTVYMDVEKAPEVVLLVRRAIATLNAHVPWMQSAPLEGNKLHASVARFLNRRQFRRIWRHVQDERVRFPTSLDSMAILKKVGRSWELYALVPLKSPEGSFYIPLTTRIKARTDMLRV